MFIEEIERHGVVTIRNVYNSDQLAQLRKEFHNEWDDICKNKDKLPWKKRLYTDTKGEFFVHKGLYHEKWTAQYGDKFIVDMSNGRFDFTLKHIPIPSFVEELVKYFLQNDYSMQYGALPVINNKKSYNGYWHRDATSLFNNEEINVSLPPFYLTMLIPLYDINIDDGPTEFIINSHRYNLSKMGIKNAKGLQSWAKDQAKMQAVMKAGDITIFNGYILHRGLANRSKNIRSMLYIVFRKNWYTDESGKDYTEINKK